MNGNFPMRKNQNFELKIILQILNLKKNKFILLLIAIIQQIQYKTFLDFSNQLCVFFVFLACLDESEHPSENCSFF